MQLHISIKLHNHSLSVWASTAWIAGRFVCTCTSLSLPCKDSGVSPLGTLYLLWTEFLYFMNHFSLHPTECREVFRCCGSGLYLHRYIIAVASDFFILFWSTNQPAPLQFHPYCCVVQSLNAFSPADHSCLSRLPWFTPVLVCSLDFWKPPWPPIHTICTSD